MKKLSPIEYSKILYKLVSEVDENDLERAVDKYLDMLVKNNAASKIDEIIDGFKKISAGAEGEKELEVTTATEIDTDIEKRLKGILGEKTTIRKKIDKSILGGMVVLDQNTLYDASLRYQLNKLKNHLE